MFICGTDCIPFIRSVQTAYQLTLDGQVNVHQTWDWLNIHQLRTFEAVIIGSQSEIGTYTDDGVKLLPARLGTPIFRRDIKQDSMRMIQMQKLLSLS